MQIVIEIPKDEYNKIINTHPNMCSFIEQQIKMGIVLPKGHGRLIDELEMHKNLNEYYYSNELYTLKMIEETIEDKVSTVLEADGNENT